MKKINILVVEDGVLLRQSLCSSLEQEAFVNKTYEAWGERTFLQAISTHEIDVILMDMRLDGTTGLDLFWKLGSLEKQPSVVAFTALSGDEVIINYLMAGVDGLLHKNDGYSAMVEAITDVCRDRFYFSRTVRAIVKRNRHRWQGVPSVQLSRQEKDVIRGVDKGLTTKQIAALLKMTPGSTTKFKVKLMRKLGVKSSNALVGFAYRNGLL